VLAGEKSSKPSPLKFTLNLHLLNVVKESLEYRVVVMSFQINSIHEKNHKTTTMLVKVELFI